MDIIVVVKGVISLFLIMLVGVYGAKKGIINEEINKGLREILLKITVPLLIVSSFNFTYDSAMKENVVRSFFFSIITILVCILISYLFLFPLKNKNKQIIQFGNVFSNCGFIGFPLIESIYGKEGVIYTSVFNMIFTIFLWTYGVALFTGKVTKKEFKKVLTSPAVIAVYIGFAMMIFNITLPDLILSPVKTLGSMTSPLSMLIVGAILSKVKLKEYIRDLSLYYGVVLKLLIMPLALIVLGKIINESSVIFNTMILLTAMPAAAMTSIFAENFNRDKEYASVLVFFTTLISIVSFPFILYLIS